VTAAPDGSGPLPLKFCYSIGWRFFRLAFSRYFKWHVYHADRVPLTGSVILASNHASYIDPPLVGAALTRHVNFLARDSIFKVPILSSILTSWEVVPVDRDGGTGRGLKAILDRLARGGAIILFPEGTRSRHGELNPGRSGIGLAVIKSAAPVVPVRVFGTFAAYGAHNTIPRRTPVAIKFGRPMFFEALRAEAKDCSRQRLKEIYQQVSNELMAEIAAMEPKED
jgi:1-acyl-sn-glycerol-3-phosphate acyltransferase